MKLRNKKTGMIVDLVEGYIKDSYYGQKIEIKPVAISNKEGYMYDSLAELNKEWEDYKEPKEFWHITSRGNFKRGNFNFVEDIGGEGDKERKQIGNYFETREEAEKAVEKLKAFKRLKDGGFKFVELRAPNYGSSDIMTIKALCPWTSKNIDDLRICFGGEE